MREGRRLKNVKKVVAEFEEKMSVKVRRQEKLEMKEKKNLRREELLGKYIVKVLYRQNDRKFEEEYLRKLERNQ